MSFDVREPILRKVYLFFLFSGVSIMLAVLFHFTIERSQSRYLAMESNERVKINLSMFVQQKIRGLQNEFQYMLLSASPMELDSANQAISTILSEIIEEVDILEHGGNHEEAIFVNYGNKESFTQKLRYSPSSEREIILPIIEMRTNLVRLEEMRKDYFALMQQEMKERSSVDENSLILYHKKISPFFQRLVENSNRLYIESLEAFNTAEEERIQQARLSQNIAFTAVPIYLVLAAVIVIWIIRDIQNLMRERSTALSSLKQTNENLEFLIAERTAELSQEVEERRNTQQEVAKQAQFLYSVIESLDHPFYVVNVEDHSVSIANEVARSKGIGGSNSCYSMILGKYEPCSEACPVSDQACPLRLVIKEKKPVILERVGIDEAGNERFMEIHGYPIFDAQGSVVQVIEYCLDVTEKEHAQQALKKAKSELEQMVFLRTRSLEEEVQRRTRIQSELEAREKHFRMLIEGIRDIIIILDHNGDIKYTSPSVEAVFGYTPEELVGRSFADFIPQETRGSASPQAILRYIISINKSGLLDHRVVDADGTIHYMESSFRSMLDVPSISGILVTSRDVTRRKESEDLQKRLNMVIEQNPSSVVITNTLGEIEYVNPKFEKVTGYKYDEVVGNNPRVLNSGLTPPEVFEDMYETISRGEVWEGEFINKKRSGELYQENVLIAPIKDDAGIITHYVALKENITELKKAREQAESASLAKSEFLSRMSHELRTPLNAVIGFSDLLLSENKKPLHGVQKKQVEYIRTAGLHLVHMISEVLDFSRIESGNISIYMQPVAASEIMSDCVKLMELEASERGISITLDDSISRLPHLRADRVRFKQVILNILSNAIKYNRDDGSIHLSCLINQDWGCISIRDTGMGIADDRKGEMFKPFSRLVEESSGIEGTGIGMAITKQLVEKMGGQISFDSEVGVGTTFRVCFPLAGTLFTKQSSDETADAETEGSVVETAETVSILYIDDRAEHIERIRNMLDAFTECSLVIRRTLEKGINASKLMTPDVVMIAKPMLGHDPDRTIQVIKTSQGESTPYVATICDEDEPAEIGQDHCLKLPVKLDELRELITRARNDHD